MAETLPLDRPAPSPDTVNAPRAKPAPGATPPASFPRNAWYMAGWGDELGETPLARRLLDMPVVLFRGDDGVARAFHDLCPHRFAPLSMGRVAGQGLACAYHGLEFDGEGHCVRNPSGGGQFPPGTHVAAFPLVERHRILWIWLGERDLADPAGIPDLHQIPRAGIGYQNLGNYLSVGVNYLLELDNIMDLTHVNYLHDGSLGNASMRGAEVAARDVGTGIRAEMWMPGSVPQFGELQGQAADQWFHVLWLPPATMVLEFGAVPRGAPLAQDPHAFAFHIFTPESETRTHYFFGTSAHHPEGEGWKADYIRKAQNGVFETEDNPMVEAVARNMAGRDFWAMRPAILPSDTAAIKVRRRIERMIRQQG